MLVHLNFQCLIVSEIHMLKIYNYAYIDKNNQIMPRPSRGYFGQIQKNGTHQIYSNERSTLGLSRSIYRKKNKNYIQILGPQSLPLHSNCFELLKKTPICTDRTLGSLDLYFLNFFNCT